VVGVPLPVDDEDTVLGTGGDARDVVEDNQVAGIPGADWPGASSNQSTA
jgi:hypothetical protein